MRKILSQIKRNEDNYAIDYIDCFEKSFGIAMEGVQQGYSNLYYLLLKYYSLYITNEFSYDYFADQPRHLKEYFLLNQLISTKLGCELHLNPVNSYAEMLEVVTNHIEQGRPVLFQGNLRELYYSSHFQETDWPHLFLIHGYDNQKHIYFILDGVQKMMDIHRYEPFVIEQQSIYKVFCSFKKVYDSNLVYAIQFAHEVNTQEIILDLFRSMFHYDNNYSSKEIELMKWLNNNFTDRDKEYDYLQMELVNIPKQKEVFFSELIASIERLLQQEDLTSHLKAEVNQLILQWKLTINRFIIMTQRGREINLEELVSPCLESEIQIRKSIAMLEDKVRTISTTNVGEIWRFENNQDQIITIEKESLTFSFENNKLYNSWVTDEAPKAMFERAVFLKNDFVFKVDVDYDNFGNVMLFHSGIVFYCNSGVLHYWGVYCGHSILLSKVKDFTNYAQIPLESKRVTLQVRREQNAYYLGYSVEHNEEIKEVFTIESLGEIGSIGVGCKTWNEAYPLKIRFLNNKVIEMTSNEITKIPPSS